MDKLKRVFKKEYLLVIFFAFVILSFLILEPIEDLDELWNYNTARCIADGLIPYKDISMITTPLLPMINAVFLKILGNEVLVMRILAGILGALTLFLTFNIFKKLFKETNISLICTFLLYLLYQDFFCIDYNFFVLFLVLCILNLEIKYTNKIYSAKFKGRKILVNLNKNKKTNLIIGILAGLCICTKQSIGVLVAFITAIYPIVWIRNKKDIKLAIFPSPKGSIMPAINLSANIKSIICIKGEITVAKRSKSPAPPTAFFIKLELAKMRNIPSEI